MAKHVSYIDAPSQQHNSLLVPALRRLLTETALAYRFSPNSYTNSAMQAVMAVEQELERLLAEVPQGHSETG